jgi:hypothetical protein
MLRSSFFHLRRTDPHLSVLDVRISEEILAVDTMIEQCHIRRDPPCLILVKDGTTYQLLPDGMVELTRDSNI